MEDLFDDDILLDDNDATSALDNVAVASLSNLVNDNLNYLKFNSYIMIVFINVIMHIMLIWIHLKVMDNIKIILTL